MWNLYLTGKEGVAIKSNVGDLYRSLNDQSIIYDKVHYLNYEKEAIPNDYIEQHNHLSTFFLKRNHYKHENEIRLIKKHIVTKEISGEKYSHLDLTKQETVEGISQHIDLTTLIDDIYVNPFSAPYFYEIIKDLIVKYELRDKEGNFLIPKISSISNEPLY